MTEPKEAMRVGPGGNGLLENVPLHRARALLLKDFHLLYDAH